ncbi:hypothetical protein KUV62_22425 [Salipiger bermudensis]|uniref:hypothetical protein n=1 Tax=Salipiger bermudensis TaxID=344736 RepID=UPI001C9A246B|nr:hypothetical protein [Salipiger bermudensis]MBY6006697.1 hypothetical protein [Salipiger bermudensis]
MSKTSSSSGVIVRLGFLVIVVGVGYFALRPVSIDDDRSPRVARLEQLSAQVQGDNQMLALAPWLNGNAYKVGAVFPVNGSFAIAHSNACDEVTSKTSDVGLVLSDKTTFAVTPDIEVVSVGKIDANATRAVDYGVTVKTGDLAGGEVELLNQLYGDPDCLAAIANREVLVLYGIYRGDERIGAIRGAKAGISADALIKTFKQNLGLKTEFSDEDKVERTDVAMYWALTKVHLDDPQFGGAETSEADRLQLATYLVESESDYAQRAIPNTEVEPPTPAELDAVVTLIDQPNG